MLEEEQRFQLFCIPAYQYLQKANLNRLFFYFHLEELHQKLQWQRLFVQQLLDPALDIRLPLIVVLQLITTIWASANADFNHPKNQTGVGTDII